LALLAVVEDDESTRRALLRRSVQPAFTAPASVPVLDHTVVDCIVVECAAAQLEVTGSIPVGRSTNSSMISGNFLAAP
jgi:hypothetical protein